MSSCSTPAVGEFISVMARTAVGREWYWDPDLFLDFRIGPQLAAAFVSTPPATTDLYTSCQRACMSLLHDALYNTASVQHLRSGSGSRKVVFDILYFGLRAPRTWTAAGNADCRPSPATLSVFVKKKCRTRAVLYVVMEYDPRNKSSGCKQLCGQYLPSPAFVLHGLCSALSNSRT